LFPFFEGYEIFQILWKESPKDKPKFETKFLTLCCAYVRQIKLAQKNKKGLLALEQFKTHILLHTFWNK
jgi:hypothetical protein